MGTIWGANESRFFSAFQGQLDAYRDTTNDKVLYQPVAPIRKLFDFREEFVKKTRQLVYAVLCVCRSTSPLMFLRIRAIHEKNNNTMLRRAEEPSLVTRT